MDAQQMLLQGYPCDTCGAPGRHIAQIPYEYYSYYCDAHKPYAVLASLPEPPAPVERVVVRTVTQYLPPALGNVRRSHPGIYGKHP